ncbi:MAG TPA: ankyrin repeat domain-containing protein [Candidatus Babeliaceae bacterium]|nr:ankyrin repeat domain-containing protein [Candidatus Babeliaceae bacterium]
MESLRLLIVIVCLLLIGITQGMNQNNPNGDSHTKQETQEDLDNQLAIKIREYNPNSELQTDRIEEIRKLIKQGANVNEGLIEAIKEIKPDIVELLIKAGANINLPDKTGKMPLHWAISSPSITKILISHGALVNYKNQYDWPTPLKLAVINSNDISMETAIALLHAGADPNATDIVFLDAEDPNSTNSNPEKVRIVYTLLDIVLLSIQFDEIKYKPAIYENFLKKFRLLILYGGRASEKADAPLFLEMLNEELPQPLIQAIALRARGKVEKLLKENPPKTEKDIVRDNDGISAIVYAAGQGNEQILSLLLSYPAYQYDTQGLEQAIEIVASRLRGLLPGTPEYKKYKTIFDYLKKQLGTTWQALINELSGYTSQEGEVHAGVLPLPPEINEYILKLTTPGAYGHIFPHGT